MFYLKMSFLSYLGKMAQITYNKNLPNRYFSKKFASNGSVL